MAHAQVNGPIRTVNDAFLDRRITQNVTRIRMSRSPPIFNEITEMQRQIATNRRYLPDGLMRPNE